MTEKSEKKTIKPKAKKKAGLKVKKKTHGERVAIYFGKGQAELLAWARAHAAKTGVGLNRIVQDGLRNVHELETGDVHYRTDEESVEEQTPPVEQQHEESAPSEAV